jgi:5'-nucleotidase
MTVLLLDMDGVLADFMAGFRADWAERGGSPLLPPDEHTGWDLYGLMPKNERHLVAEVMNAPGFFAELPPVEGAVEAVHEIMREHEVLFCSTPWDSSPTCLSEKAWWLQKHFGKGASKRAIFTFDKTLVHGRILVDDNPEILGRATPTWEHVVFSQNYNAHVKDRRRLDRWSEWRSVL